MAQFTENRIPGAPDFARLISDDPEAILAGLKEHYSRPRIGWSYQWVQRNSRKIYSGELTEASINEYQASGKRKGAKSNVEVALLLRQSAIGRSFQCFPIKPRRVKISREHSLTVSPPFYFVENGVVKIFWLQPRRTFALDDQQAGVLAALLRLSHFRDDFEDARLELYDASAPDGKNREPRVLGLSDLPVVSDRELTRAMEAFVWAYEQVRYTNFRASSPPTSKERKQDERQTTFEDMFGFDPS